MTPELGEQQSPEFWGKVNKRFLGFCEVNLLAYLSESGLFEELDGGGIEIVEGDDKRFGPQKMRAGNLGLLYALGHLDRKGGQYVLSTDTIIDNESVLKAIAFREILREYEGVKKDGDQAGAKNLELLFGVMDDGVIEAGGGIAFVMPWVSAIKHQAEWQMVQDSDLCRYVDSLLVKDEYQKMKLFLRSVGMLGGDNKLNTLGKTLIENRATSSFAALGASYGSIAVDLWGAENDPGGRTYGGRYSRNQEENALASNKLIRNTIKKFRSFLQERGYQRILDLGSGGGFFAFGLDVETILFDMSQIANDHAEKLFNKDPEKLVGKAITGNILNENDLKRAADRDPDVVTINYIVHDIVGQANSYEEGLKALEKFLVFHKRVFGKVPLLVTESWHMSWSDLRNKGRSYLKLYKWLHEISPQQLLRKKKFIEIAERAGLVIEEPPELIHGKIGKDEEEVNQTLVLRASD